MSPRSTPLFSPPPSTPFRLPPKTTLDSPSALDSLECANEKLIITNECLLNELKEIENTKKKFISWKILYFDERNR